MKHEKNMIFGLGFYAYRELLVLFLFYYRATNSDSTHAQKSINTDF